MVSIVTVAPRALLLLARLPVREPRAVRATGPGADEAIASLELECTTPLGPLKVCRQADLDPSSIVSSFAWLTHRDRIAAALAAMCDPLGSLPKLRKAVESLVVGPERAASRRTLGLPVDGAYDASEALPHAGLVERARSLALPDGRPFFEAALESRFAPASDTPHIEHALAVLLVFLLEGRHDRISRVDRLDLKNEVIARVAGIADGVERALASADAAAVERTLRMIGWLAQPSLEVWLGAVPPSAGASELRELIAQVPPAASAVATAARLDDGPLEQELRRLSHAVGARPIYVAADRALEHALADAEAPAFLDELRSIRRTALAKVAVAASSWLVRMPDDKPQRMFGPPRLRLGLRASMAPLFAAASCGGEPMWPPVEACVGPLATPRRGGALAACGVLIPFVDSVRWPDPGVVA